GRGKRSAGAQSSSRTLDVELSPAGVLVAPDRAGRAAARSIDVVCVPLEDRRDLAVRQRRIEAEENRCGRRHLRRRERGALGPAIVARRAVGVALGSATLLVARQRLREGGEDVDSGGG